MLSNRFTFVVLGIACVAAAAGGGYLATRQNTTDRQAAVTEPAPPQATPAAATSPASSLAQPVQSTNTASDDSAKNASQPAAQPLPAKRGAAVDYRGAVEHSAPSQASQPPISKTPTETVARNAQPSTIERTRPTGAASVQDSTSSVFTQGAPLPQVVDPSAPAPRQDDLSAPEPSKAAEPDKAPEKSFQDLVVSADSVIGVQLETTITSERARVEDRVDARVIRDVRVGNQVAIPSGSRVIGSVMTVERGGKFKERARLGIRFNTLVLADGTQLPITTETIYRYGEAPSNSSAGKIGGGAVGGAILGAILGGAKGAAIGAGMGAGGGAAVAAAGDRDAATFPAGTQMTARFLSPVTVTIEK